MSRRVSQPGFLCGVMLAVMLLGASPAVAADAAGSAERAGAPATEPAPPPADTKSEKPVTGKPAPKTKREPKLHKLRPKNEIESDTELAFPTDI